MRLVILLVMVLAAPAFAQDGRVTHALSLFDDIKYPPDFEHFEYVNPDAPKGGTVVMSALGTFDSLNPFIVKGTPAAGSSSIYDTLMASAQDEPSTSYGLLAESVEVAPDLSWVIFNLRPEARWHDGQPLTADDVIFTFNLLKEQGRPHYRYYYANVEPPEKLGPHKVRFRFSGGLNRELPLIIGQLSVLPKHYWEGREFNAATLAKPLGSGPYRIGEVNPGRSIQVELVDDYWGKDLPVNRGQNNMNLRYEYYRDSTIAIEAFKSHQFDFRLENSAKEWATAYDNFPALKRGHVVKEMLENNNPTGMQSFAFNLRRAKFRDRRVREAIGLTFDFEWSNRNLFYGQYTRIDSFFSNSELAARGLPSEAELRYLEPLRDQVPPEVFTKEYQPPKTDGSGNVRSQLREAARLLREAGWQISDGRLVDESGNPFTIEFLIVQPSFERIVAPMVRNLKRLGIDSNSRIVDVSQYQNRVDNFEFDIIVDSWGQSLSPGNEQRDFWGSEAADRPGSQNTVGIKNPAVDRLIDHVIAAESRQELVAATRALDRVLLWNHYVIPQFTIQTYRVLYWNRFGMPETKPKYGLGFPGTWWIDREKDAALKAAGVR